MTAVFGPSVLVPSHKTRNTTWNSVAVWVAPAAYADPVDAVEPEQHPERAGIERAAAAADSQSLIAAARTTAISD